MYLQKPFQKNKNINDHNSSTKKYGSKDSNTNPYKFIKHKVKGGESLDSLAKKYNVSKQEIINANNGVGGVWNKYDRSKNWLYKGENLKIPISKKEQYDLEMIKQWIEEQSNGSTQTTPKAHQKSHTTPQKTMRLDYSPQSHHSNKPDFPSPSINFNEWYEITTGDQLTLKELKDVKVYIFYIDDFKTQSKKMAIEAIQKYGEEKVALGKMKDAWTFIKLWSKMKGDPKTVIINTHGKNQSITTGHGEGGHQFTSTENNETNIRGTEVFNIQDLPIPKANFSETLLQLNSCHSNDTEPKEHLKGDHKQGNLKGTMHTAAEAFLRKFKFKEVRATKGAVNYAQWFHWNHPKLETGDPYPKDDRWEHMSLEGDEIKTRIEDAD